LFRFGDVTKELGCRCHVVLDRGVQGVMTSERREETWLNRVAGPGRLDEDCRCAREVGAVVRA